MICLAPRAPGDSVRPRRSSGASARPLNFTVRFRMRQALALLVTALVTLESSLLPAQTEKTYVLVAAETCKIGNLAPQLHR